MYCQAISAADLREAVNSRPSLRSVADATIIMLSLSKNRSIIIDVFAPNRSVYAFCSLQHADFFELALLCCFHDFSDSSSYLYFQCVSFILFRNALLKFCAAAQGIEVGPYAIVNCNSNAINIAKLVKSLESFIRPVIADLGSPTASDAYMTFFKDIRYRSYVREVFSNITKGASVVPEPGIPGVETRAPIFFCVDGRDQFTWETEDNSTVDAYTQCRSYTEVPAMALLNTPYTIICPAFHSQPATPAQSAASCYKVVPNQNRFEQDGKNLIRYQIWHIIHELVHYYVWSTEEMNFDVYPINACLNLRNRFTVFNPNSYTYYASSRSSTQLLLFRSRYA